MNDIGLLHDRTLFPNQLEPNAYITYNMASPRDERTHGHGVRDLRHKTKRKLNKSERSKKFLKSSRNGSKLNPESH